MKVSVKATLAILIAAVFSLVFLQCVYFEFEKVRTPLVYDATPSTEGSLQVHFEPPEHKEVNILLLEIQNDADTDRHLQFILNDALIFEKSVPARSTKMYLFDAGSSLRFDKENLLLMKGDGANWIAKRLEIRNLYGSFKTFLTYVVVARDLPQAGAGQFAAALLFFVGLSAVGIYGQKGRAFFGNRITAIPIVCVAAVYLLIVLLPLFSKYRLLLSFNSFLLLSLICYAAAIRNSYSRLYRQLDQLHRGGGRAFQSVVVILTVFCFYYLSMKDSLMEFKGNYSGFLTLSEKFSQRNPFLRQQPELLNQLKINPGYGYDSQFFYAITFDPFLRRFEAKPGRYSRVVDSPPFRFRRIGFPLLTKLFSADQPALYPKTMILLILFSCIPGAFFLVRIALFYQKNPSWGLLYLLVPAFTLSLHLGLPEPIAASFFLGGFYFYVKQKFKLSTVFFALSLLIRETTALGIVLLALFEFFQKKNKKNAIILLSALLPYAGWRFYVGWRLFTGYGWRAFVYEPANFNFPFSGIFQMFWNISKGTWSGIYSTGIVIFPFVLTAILLISFWQMRKRLEFLSVATFIYALLAVSLSYHAVWLGLANPERQTFECFLLLILFFLSLDEKRQSAKIACMAVFSFILIYDFFFLSVEKYFRAGLLLN